jgi:hypothetical protein
MWQRYNGTTKIFEKSTDSGGTWNPLDLDVAILTQGALAKARQHAQTAYLDAGNVFSAAANEFAEILKADKGIQFPAAQVASANVNCLDDYEEGTWTPTIASTGGGAPTYTTQQAGYVKVGYGVWFTIHITTATIGTLAAGNITITGLPFVVGSIQSAISFSYFSGLATSMSSLGGALNVGASAITLTYVPAAGATGHSILTKADLGGAVDLILKGFYAI